MNRLLKHHTDSSRAPGDSNVKLIKKPFTCCLCGGVFSNSYVNAPHQKEERSSASLPGSCTIKQQIFNIFVSAQRILIVESMLLQNIYVLTVTNINKTYFGCTISCSESMLKNYLKVCNRSLSFIWWHKSLWKD